MSDQFAVTLAQWEGFQFLVDFNQDGVTDLLTDEPAPVGQGKGPDPARLLAAAVGNCLASSLLFCLKKAHINVLAMKCVVEGDMVRNDKGRLRIGGMRVKLEPSVAEADLARVNQCAAIYEDYCIVTQSVKKGMDVTVELLPNTSATGPILVI